MDKSLSISLGRASLLHDYDIDVDLPRIQGQVYERLYSPKALKDGPCPGDLLRQIQMQQEKLHKVC